MKQEISIALEAGSPTLLIGEPGTGKTSFLRALAKESNRHLETLLGGCIGDTTDVIGIPVKQGDGVEYALPAWFKRLEESKHGALFLDELTCAPRSAQATMLRLVCEKALHNRYLKSDTWIIAACNPSEQGGNELSEPMANRFFHVPWKVDSSSWARQFQHGFEMPQLKPCQDVWLKFMHREKSLVANFIKRKPALLSQPANGGAFASPRSWEMVARHCAVASAIKEPITPLLIEGCIGNGPGLEYTTWRREMDLPSPEDALEGNWEIDKKRPEKTLATLQSMVPLVLDITAWDKAWIQIARVTAKDLQILAATSLCSQRPDKAKLPNWILDFANVLIKDSK